MITASIVTYHTAANELEKCLATLNSSAVSRVYVVDNSCLPRIAELSRRYGACYIAHLNNGYGAAHNTALRKAIAEGSTYHLVMNSDIEFSSPIIARLADYMDAHPDVGQLQPRIVCPDQSLQHTCRLLPTPADLFIRRFLPGRFFTKRRRRYLLDSADWNREFDCAYQQGSFMFFRMSALNRIGLFDERFFMYPEDIDISRRMAACFKVRYWPGTTVVHHHAAASYRSWRMLWVHFSNMVRYFNKWGWFSDRGRSRMNAAVLAQFSDPTTVDTQRF